jgi:hypothetical protein
MSLEQELSSWDKKSALDIQAIYDSYHTQSNFAETIIKLSLTGTHEKGATWLLKLWLESGNMLAKSQISKIYKSLKQLEHWEAKLHVLQAIPFMAIDDTNKNNVYNFLRTNLTDQNKFVRAWSYNGFHELSRQHPEYLEETQQYFEMAMRDEAPSVKARIRNIMKKGL